MKTLVLGASGATGKYLVEQLLLKGQNVKVIIRPSANIPHLWINDQRITIIKAQISEMSLEEAIHLVKDCQAIISCLGHTMSLKGIYGKPKNLVVNAVRLFCYAIEKNTLDSPIKFILMNTVGYRNKDTDKQISLCQKIVISIIRNLLPPHLDNEKAADFLKINIGQTSAKIQWVIVRPDSLTDEDTVLPYDTHISPIGTLFKPGKVSRINVAHFMASLIEDNDLWEKWIGKMPVIYNNPDR